MGTINIENPGRKARALTLPKAVSFYCKKNHSLQTPHKTYVPFHQKPYNSSKKLPTDTIASRELFVFLTYVKTLDYLIICDTTPAPTV